MMEVEDQVQPSYQLSRKEKFMRYFRKFIQWLFSYVGLTAILAGYLFLGAIVFQAIEGPEEQRLKEVMVMEKKKLLTSFYNKCTELNYTDWEKYALHELNKFDMKTNAKNGTIDNNDRVKWSFFGSMLFSLTVVTTIGYGHIAPMTIHGQVICIVYALIGIPLMLLVLTNVGRVLANTARLLFKMYSSQLCKKVRCQDRRSQQRRASKRKKSIQRKNSKKLEKKNSSKRKSLKREPTFKGPPSDEKFDNIEIEKESTITNNSRNIDSQIFAALYCECNETKNDEQMWLDRVDSMNDSTLRDVSSTNLSCTSDNVFETKSQVPHQQPDLQEKNTNSGLDANEKEAKKEQNEEKTVEEETPEIFASVEDSFLHKYLRPSSCSSLASTPKQNPELFGVKRRCSCVDFRQFDQPENQEKDKPAKETLHYSLRKHQPVEQRYYMDARPNKITHSESLPNIKQQPVRKQKEKEKFYSLRTKRKQKLHSGLAHPTLSSLMKPIDMKIQNSATAIRLATYCKIKGSSREDLTTGISEVSDEDTRLLDWTDSAHSRKKLLSSSSTTSIETSKRSQKSIKKKNKPTDDSQDLSDIAEIDSINSEDGMKQRTITEADIPITPVLIFFFSYVILGAVMFYFLEKGWNLPNAIYFCFITLTTIGFGDYVPDTSLYSLIACCIYTAVGMAITSMCIALIMKKFVLQVKKLGRKIGILTD